MKKANTRATYALKYSTQRRISDNTPLMCTRRIQCAPLAAPPSKPFPLSEGTLKVSMSKRNSLFAHCASGATCTNMISRIISLKNTVQLSTVTTEKCVQIVSRFSHLPLSLWNTCRKHTRKLSTTVNVRFASKLSSTRSILNSILSVSMATILAPC